MPSVSYYMHHLAQLACGLRDAADSLESVHITIKQFIADGKPIEEVRQHYLDFLEQTYTTKSVDDLNELVTAMQHDSELTPCKELEPDILRANQRCLELCAKLLEIATTVTAE